MSNLVCALLQIVVWVIIAWIVLSYVITFGRLGWGHPVRRLYDRLSKVIDPVMQPIRKAVPPLRIGGAAIDLSPLILILGITVLMRILCD